MNFKQLTAKFGELKQTTTALAMSNVILVILLLISLAVNFQKDTVVMNNLNESCLQSEVGRSSMNAANHVRLGFYLSGMLGNITPTNIGFVEKAVLPFMASNIYQDVKKAIDLQLAELKRDEVVMTFTPETSVLENGTTYITGRGTLTGPTGKVEKFIRTYEFDFVVENYTALVHYVDVYDDVAHDAVWQKKHQKRSGGKS